MVADFALASVYICLLTFIPETSIYYWHIGAPVSHSLDSTYYLVTKWRAIESGISIGICY